MRPRPAGPPLPPLSHDHRRTPHRLTPSQRRLLQIIRSFGPAGATERLIELVDAAPPRRPRLTGRGGLGSDRRGGGSAGTSPGRSTSGQAAAASSRRSRTSRRRRSRCRPGTTARSSSSSPPASTPSRPPRPATAGRARTDPPGRQPARGQARRTPRRAPRRLEPPPRTRDARRRPSEVRRPRAPRAPALHLGSNLAEDSPYDSLWGCRDRFGGYTGQNFSAARSCASRRARRRRLPDTPSRAMTGAPRPRASNHAILRARRRQRPPHRAAPPAPRRPAAEASAMSQLYIVEVDDHCNPTLSGHSGCSYTSPPQPEVQALALVRALLNCTQGPLTRRRRPLVGADRRRPADHPPARRPGRRPAHHLTGALRCAADRGRGAAGAAPSGGCRPSPPRSRRS